MASVPTFVALSVANFGTEGGPVTSGSINKPTGVADEDILIASVSASDATAVPTLLSGWTALYSNQALGGNPAAEAYVESVWWKLASSEPASYTINYSAGVVVTNKIFAFRGVHQTTPINASSAAVAFSDTSTGTSVITTVDECLAFFLNVAGEDVAVTTPPAGYAALSSSGANVNFYDAYTKEIVAAGATGSPVAVYATAPFNYTAAFLIALAPPDDPPPPSGDIILINFGPVDQDVEKVLMTTDAVESDDCFLGAFRYRLADQAMRVVDGGTIVANNVGLGFASDGALVVTTSTSAADANYNGLATIAGRLKVSYLLTESVHIHGWPVSSTGVVVATTGA